MSRCAVRVGQQLVEDLVEVGRRRDHREHNVSVGEVAWVVDHCDPEFGQRLSLGPGSVPGGHIHPGTPQSLREGEAHPPGADPSNSQLCVVHRRDLFRG